MPVTTRSTSQEDLLEFVTDITRLEREVRRATRIQREIENQETMEVPLNREIGPQQRPIGAFDEPNQREVSLGIVAPPLENGGIVELKPSTLAMIERSTFKGNAVECPLEHLDRFERICKALRMGNVPEDTLKMMLFPFSLEDKGNYWEKTIPTSKVSTWADVKKEFLAKFFPKQKTAKFRNEIQSFQQHGSESLSEAWDRLRGLIRSCPHHGMSKENLLGIFYRGVHTEIRRALDTASYGSFASLDVDQAERLIENLAQSDASFGNDYDRSTRKQVASVDEAKSMADLKRELDEEITNKMCAKMEKIEKVMVSNAKSTPQSSSGQGFYQDPSQAYGYWDQFGNFQWASQEGYQGGYQEGGDASNYNASEEVNYVGNQGGYNNFKPFNQHPNLSYRNPNVENPQDQAYPNPSNTPNQASQNRPSFYPNSNQQFNPRPPQGHYPPRPTNFNQYQAQNRPFFPNNQWNPPSNFQGGNPQGNFQQQQQQGSSSNLEQTNVAIKAILKRLENLELKKEAPPPPKQATFFPSNPIVNPKAPSSNTLQVAKDNEDEGEEIDWYGVRDLKEGSDSKQEPTISLKIEPAPPQAPVIRAKIEIAPMPIHGSIEEKNRWRMTEMAKILATMPFREALKTYPLFFGASTDTDNDTQDIEEEATLVDDVEEPMDKVEELEEEIVEVETIEKEGSVKDLLNDGDNLERFYSRLAFAKAILANKEEVEQLIKDIESPKESLKVLEKKGSPGMFSIPCVLGDCIFDGAFCDSGSYVSVISSHLASAMKLDGMQRCSSLVTFGDQSKKRPKGIFKDFPIKIGNCLVPTDLLVLDMVDEGNQSLLLGIPFLLTVGAKMDYVNRVVCFENIDKKTFYPLDNNGRNLVGTILEQEPIFTINAASEGAQDNPQVDPSKATKKKKVKPKATAKINARMGKEHLAKGPPPKAEHSPIIFVPTKLVDGKLECKVRTRHGVSPFAKARIVLGSTSHVKEGHLFSEKMATLFNMKLVDYGPQPPCPPPLEN